MRRFFFLTSNSKVSTLALKANGGSCMQYQKEEIRTRILESALEEFAAFGYLGAQMRRIAEGAGVATGNVYRYFESKDEVFEAIVQPVYANMSTMVLDLYKTGNRDVKAIASDIAARIMAVYSRYARELLIITDRSQGSGYENFTETLVTLVAKRIKGELFHDEDETDELLAFVIASGFVRAIFLILRNSSESASVEKLLNRTLIFYFNHLDERLT